MQTNKYTFSFKKSLSQEVYIEKITKAELEKETNAKSLYFFIDEYRQVISIIKDILHNNSAGIKMNSKDDCDKRTKCKKFSILQDESHNNHEKASLSGTVRCLSPFGLMWNQITPSVWY